MPQVNLSRRTGHLARAALVCLILLLQGCEQPNEMTPQERALLITVAEFAPYVKGTHDPNRGNFTKESNPVINSRELSYKFEYSKSEKEAPLYLSTVVSVQPRLLKPYDRVLHKAGFAIGFAFGKLKQEPLPDFPTYGDRSSMELLTLEGRPVGNLFTAEYGRKSVRLILTGIYVRDPAVWQEMFGEKLRLIEKFEEPKSPSSS